MKAKEFRKVESLLNLIGKENAPKAAKIFEACGINWYNNQVFTPDYVFESKEKFLSDWERLNNFESYKADLLEKYGLNNKKVASFFKENFNSGYSMGELEQIIITSEFDAMKVNILITVRDGRKKYTGAHSSTYNKNVSYGVKVLFVIVKNGRAKYELKENIKK